MSLVIRLARSIAGAARTGQRVAIEVLPILGKPSAAVEPSKGAFDDPTAWKHHESFRPIGALDDFSFELRQDLRQGLLKVRPLVATIGKELFQERVHPEKGRKKQDAAIAILDIGRMNDGVQQQTQRVYENMALLPLDLFARVIAMRIDASPPFSALFTLWLSTMAAVGLASRSPCTSVVPLSNQVTTLNHKRFKGFKMFSDGHLAISPKGDLALAILVAGNSDKKAWFSRKSGAAVALRIDGKKVIKVGEIGVGGLAEGVAFSADGVYAYVGNFLDNDISILKINGTQVTDTGKKLKLPGHPASLRGAPK